MKRMLAAALAAVVVVGIAISESVCAHRVMATTCSDP